MWAHLWPLSTERKIMWTPWSVSTLQATSIAALPLDRIFLEIQKTELSTKSLSWPTDKAKATSSLNFAMDSMDYKLHWQSESFWERYCISNTCTQHLRFIVTCKFRKILPLERMSTTFNQGSKDWPYLPGLTQPHATKTDRNHSVFRLRKVKRFNWAWAPNSSHQPAPQLWGNFDLRSSAKAFFTTSAPHNCFPANSKVMTLRHVLTFLGEYLPEMAATQQGKERRKVWKVLTSRNTSKLLYKSKHEHPQTWAKMAQGMDVAGSFWHSSRTALRRRSASPRDLKNKPGASRFNSQWLGALPDNWHKNYHHPDHLQKSQLYKHTVTMPQSSVRIAFPSDFTRECPRLLFTCLFRTWNLALLGTSLLEKLNPNSHCSLTTLTLSMVLLHSLCFNKMCLSRTCGMRGLRILFKSAWLISSFKLHRR